MSRFKYKDILGGALIAAVLLCIYRTAHYLISGVGGFLQYLESKQNPYDYDYAGGLMPYLDAMTPAVDITEVIVQLVMAAAISCLGAAAALVLLKGTEKPLLSALLCLPVLGVSAFRAFDYFTMFAFFYERPLGIVLYGLITALLITVMIWLPKNMNVRRDHILWLLLGVFVLVLIANDAFSSSALPFSPIDALTMVLAVGGVVEAVRHDNGVPVIEKDEGEEEEAEEIEE